MYLAFIVLVGPNSRHKFAYDFGGVVSEAVAALNFRTAVSRQRVRCRRKALVDPEKHLNRMVLKMRRFLENKLVQVAVLSFFMFAFVLSAGTPTPSAIPASINIGPTMPPSPWDGVSVAIGPTMPPSPWDGVSVAIGPTMPPSPWDGVSVAIGPTMPPSPWDGVSVAIGPTMPPSPWDGLA
jgi:hypothetical protein